MAVESTVLVEQRFGTPGVPVRGAHSALPTVETNALGQRTSDFHRTI